MTDHLTDVDRARYYSRWCSVCVAPTRLESAGPLGYLDRCTMNPEHWHYRGTDDPNVLDRRETVRIAAQANHGPEGEAR